MWVLGHDLSRRHQTDDFEHAHRLGLALTATELGPVQLEAPQDRVADHMGRVERTEGVLEHHRDLSPVFEQVPATPKRFDLPATEQYFSRSRPVDHDEQSGHGRLPEPDSPTNATISRSSMCMSRSSTACTMRPCKPPTRKCRVRPLVSPGPRGAFESFRHGAAPAPGPRPAPPLRQGRRRRAGSGRRPRLRGKEPARPVLQLAMAFLQRGLKLQPGGRAARSGGFPGTPSRGALRTYTDGKASRRPWV